LRKRLFRGERKGKGRGESAEERLCDTSRYEFSTARKTPSVTTDRNGTRAKRLAKGGGQRQRHRLAELSVREGPSVKSDVLLPGASIHKGGNRTSVTKKEKIRPKGSTAL